MEGGRSARRGDTGLSTENEELDAILRSIARAPPRRVAPDPTAGARWGDDGRYVVEHRLGRGGMGTVYVASDTLLGRLVALKVLDRGDVHETKIDRARLLREARLAAALEHERVARVYDVGEHDGSAFVAMEYVRGVTLRTFMSERAATPGQIVTLLSQIAEGLAVLHSNGVVHRDLKPENVMMPTSGGVKLLDFGLARHVTLSASSDAPVALDTAATSAVRAGEALTDEECLARTVDARAAAVSAPRVAESSLAPFLGTPGYMAPEQCLAEAVDSRADVFALGVIVCELVTGDRPFKGETLAELLHATLESAPQLEGAGWERFPKRLRRATARMLERAPEARFADGAEVLAELRAVVPVSSAQRRLRAALVAGGVALMGAAVWLAVPQARERARELARGKPAPPAGMAVIDEGTLTVGRAPADFERQCAQLGATCDRALLSMQAPEVRVTVPAFALDVHEVTNREMVETLNTLRASFQVMEDVDHHFPRYVRFNSEEGALGDFLVDLYPGATGIEYTAEQTYRALPGFEELPAVQITWHGATLYCESHGKRLPTEDEWEAAARGAANRTFPWGEAPARCGQVALPRDGAVPMDASCATEARVMAVGTAAQDVTPNGIHDLGGNVAEWVGSAYYDGSRGQTADNPGPQHARVFRGGSFIHAVMAHTSIRNRRMPNAGADNLGFRCAVGAHF